MNNNDLTNAIANYLINEAKSVKNKERKFTAGELANMFNASPGNVGNVKDDVLGILRDKGIKVEYVKNKYCKFLIFPKQ